MCPLVRSLFVGALIFALFPGLSEVLENVVHLAAEGHAAHARQHGDEHSRPGPEHGCNGTFHLCSCHVSLSYLVARPLPPVRSATPRAISRRREPVSLHTGFHYIPERPPRA